MLRHVCGRRRRAIQGEASRTTEGVGHNGQSWKSGLAGLVGGPRRANLGIIANAARGARGPRQANPGTMASGAGQQPFKSGLVVLGEQGSHDEQTRESGLVRLIGQLGHDRQTRESGLVGLARQVGHEGQNQEF